MLYAPNLTDAEERSEFSAVPAVVPYAGLSVSAVGLYRFNITVPDVPDGDNRIGIAIDGMPAQPNLYLTIQR
jgi:uncharacterized protein (TIGR03437 family)